MIIRSVTRTFVFFFFTLYTFLYTVESGNSSEKDDQRSIIIRSGKYSSPWSENEKEIIRSFCRELPGEFFDFGEISFIKKKKKKSKNPIIVNLKTNRIIIRQSFRNSKDLKVVILRGLATLLDKKYKYSDSFEWRKISRWTGWDILGNRSENINPRGFVSQEAQKNPRKDFIMSITHFFLSPEYENGCEYLKNRISFKYNFIRNIFLSRPDPQAGILCPETYLKWIDPKDIEHIELLIASPSYVSIASIAGHLSLLIKRKKDISGLSTVVSFVAKNIDKNGDPEHGWKYVYNGIFGKYISILQEETLLELINRQTVSEDRDIYRLKLQLTKQQIDKLIRRLWDFKTNFNYKYYFFNKNCTTMLLNLINFVLDKDNVIKDYDTIDLPLNIVFKIFKSFNADFIYPEYWSLSRNARFSYKKNIEIKSEILKLFKKVLNTDTISCVNKLFKEAVNLKHHERKKIYPELYKIFTDMVNQKKKDPSYKKDIGRIGELLLEFFINSKDSEQFYFHRELSHKIKQKSDNVPEIFFETERIRYLVEYILNIRNILKSKFNKNVQKTYDNIEKERSLDAFRERKKSTFGSNYGLLLLTPGFYSFGSDNYFSFSVKSSTYLQKMGDKSVFSMGSGTEIELLSLKLTLSKKADLLFFNSITKNWLFEKGYTLINFKKIFQKKRLEYTGIMNSGFGIRLFSFYSSQIKKYDKTDYLMLSYILNIFERNSFADFLNFEIGSGFSKIKYYDHENSYCIDLFANIDFNFHLFGKYSNIFRGSFSFIPHISIYDNHYSFNEIKGKIETDLSLNSRRDILLTTGIYFSKNTYLNSGHLNMDNTFKISFNSTIKFHGRIIPSVKGVKKVLNRLF